MSAGAMNQEEIRGFGYIDAMDEDVVSEKIPWVIDGLLPLGLGFIAGPPKAKNSPMGGKSVFLRAMAGAIATGQPFLDRPVLKSGKSLLINLDESPGQQIHSVRLMMNGQSARGVNISKATSMLLPEDLSKLKQDIQDLKPLLVAPDPLGRFVPGKDLNTAKDTSPVTTGLKLLASEYNLVLPIVHHSNKSPTRDKESTASWLNGSVDLDSTWNFCLCLEWDSKKKANHLRCFYRSGPRLDIYYRAIFDEKKENIVGLEVTEDDVKADSKNLTTIVQALLKVPNQTSTLPKLVGATGLSKATVWRYLTDHDKIFKRTGQKQDGAEEWTPA